MPSMRRTRFTAFSVVWEWEMKVPHKAMKVPVRLGPECELERFFRSIDPLLEWKSLTLQASYDCNIPLFTHLSAVRNVFAVS